ncbi:hypothetical protein BH09SUM1_BH09SUM1_23940 [soil metagenome]
MIEKREPGESDVEDDEEFDEEIMKLYRQPGGLAIPIYYFVRFIAWLVAKVYFRTSFHGAENIPSTGPVLLACNHASNLDPEMVAALCRRRIAFLAKSELFENRVFGGFIGLLGAFPIRRGTGGGDRAAIRSSIMLLRTGNALLMFPEGERTLTGVPGVAKTGVSMLLARAPDAVIVPIRVDGSYEAFPPGKKFPRPRKIRVTAGQGFRVADLKNLPTVKKQLYQRVGEEIMKRIACAGSSA